MTKLNDRRLSRLETPHTQEPAMGDWLDWLAAEDQPLATAELIRRFPIIATPGYVSPMERLDRRQA